jgi:hypothetical protein
MLLLFFRPHVYGETPIPVPELVTFSGESYSAPSVGSESYEGEE